MASLFEPTVQVPGCETMHSIDRGAGSSCTCQSQRTLLWAGMEVRHNQVGVQDRKWPPPPPPPDRMNQGHAGEQPTCSILKDLSVSLDRHFSSNALLLRAEASIFSVFHE